MLIDAKIEALSLHEETKTEMSSTLVTKNMQLAHEKYDDFVDVSGPLLTMSEFQTRRSLQLKEQCAAVF